MPQQYEEMAHCSGNFLIKSTALICLLAVLCWSCTRPQEPAGYPEQVGDIAFDPDLDDPDFKICDEKQVLQYYNFGKGVQYKGEKLKITEHFLEIHERSRLPEDSGYLTIRFIVNCEGQTGRFRVTGMDNDYNEREFSDKTVEYLLARTKIMDGWIPGELDGRKYDYYQYLTFKLEDGGVIQVLP